MNTVLNKSLSFSFNDFMHRESLHLGIMQYLFSIPYLDIFKKMVSEKKPGGHCSSPMESTILDADVNLHKPN